MDVTEPVVTFSPCFGGAFLTKEPKVYSKLLKEKIDKYDTKVYLVNRGWTGGGFGVGKRISIQNTRTCIDSILDGSIESSTNILHPIFDLEFLTVIKGVPPTVSNPMRSWKDQLEYIKTCELLQKLFDDKYEYIKRV